MTLRPEELLVLLNLHLGGNGYPVGNYQPVSELLVTYGLAESSPPKTYSVTPKGKKLIEMLCETPMPEVHWTDPRTAGAPAADLRRYEEPQYHVEATGVVSMTGPVELEMPATPNPLRPIVVVGPSDSGKSSKAIVLARTFGAVKALKWADVSERGLTDELCSYGAVVIETTPHPSTWGRVRLEMMSRSPRPQLIFVLSGAREDQFPDLFQVVRCEP